MAETKTSISELTAATSVGQNDLLFISQQNGSAWNSKKATVSQLPFGQGTITGITMNGASKGTSGNVDLGTVLTAHQSLASYVPTSRTVAGQQLTANVTAATISSAIGLGNYLPLTGGNIQNTEDTYIEVKSTSSNGTSYVNVVGANGVHSLAIYADASYPCIYVDDTYEVKVQAKDGTLALTSDIPTVPVKQVKLNGTALTPDASGAVNVNALTAHQSLDSCLKNTGSQTIFSCHTLNLRSDTMDSTVVPESSVQSPRIQLQDKNAYSVGFILCDRHTSGRQSLIMRARQTIDGVDSYADIGVAVNADGTKYAYCPTPASSANNTSIATTAWVRSRMSGDYVSKAELKTALASVGQIPSGDGANLENTIAKFNALFTALSALTD